MSWTLPPTVAAGKTRSFTGALTTLLAGLLLLAPAAVAVAPPVYRALTSPVISVPGGVTRHLTPGRYAVFERTGTKRSAGPVTASTDHGVTIRPSDVGVIDPQGNLVNVELMRGITETIDRNGAVFTAAVQFQVRTSGTYKIGVAAEQRGQVVVSPTLSYIVRRAAGALLAAALGAVALLLALVLLFVNARRPKARTSTPSLGTQYAMPMLYPPVAPLPATAPPPMLLPPAAWYPDPERPGGQRYWDGQSWTDHRA